MTGRTHIMNTKDLADQYEAIRRIANHGPRYGDRVLVRRVFKLVVDDLEEASATKEFRRKMMNHLEEPKP